MDLYTSTVYGAHKDDDFFMDITVKSSGHVGRVFAPTWQMVMDYKKHAYGHMSGEVYTEEYYQLMLKSYAEHRDKWDWVLAQRYIILACYCPPYQFCHRHLLTGYLTTLGANYKGEI